MWTKDNLPTRLSQYGIFPTENQKVSGEFPFNVKTLQIEKHFIIIPSSETQKRLIYELRNKTQKPFQRVQEKT